MCPSPGAILHNQGSARILNVLKVSTLKSSRQGNVVSNSTDGWDPPHLKLPLWQYTESLNTRQVHRSLTGHYSPCMRVTFSPSCALVATLYRSLLSQQAPSNSGFKNYESCAVYATCKHVVDLV